MAFIHRVGSALALLPPTLPSQSESELLGQLCRKKEVNKKQEKVICRKENSSAVRYLSSLVSRSFQGRLMMPKMDQETTTTKKNEFIEDLKHLVELSNSVCQVQLLPVILFACVILRCFQFLYMYSVALYPSSLLLRGNCSCTLSYDQGDVSKSYWLLVSRGIQIWRRKKKQKRTTSATKSHQVDYQICWLFALLGRLLHSSHLGKIRRSLLRPLQHIFTNRFNFSLCQAGENRKLIALILQLLRLLQFFSSFLSLQSVVSEVIHFLFPCFSRPLCPSLSSGSCLYSCGYEPHFILHLPDLTGTLLKQVHSTVIFQCRSYPCRLSQNNHLYAAIAGASCHVSHHLPACLMWGCLQQNAHFSSARITPSEQ